jgi:uncharacterized protein
VSRVRILPAPRSRHPASAATGTVVHPMDVVRMDGPGGGWLVRVPTTRRERMRGLRGHPPPGPREGMLFRRCRSVHTFGMPCPIAIVLLDARMRVISVRRCRPGSLVLPRRRVRHVLECDVGASVGPGDRFRTAGPATR